MNLLSSVKSVTVLHIKVRGDDNLPGGKDHCP